MDSGLDIVNGSYNREEFTATPSHVDFGIITSPPMPKLNKIVDYTVTNPSQNPDANPDDCYGYGTDYSMGHGTGVAGILAGQGNANSAYSGYAPATQLNIYKVTVGCTGVVNMTALNYAISDAIDDEVNVINLSMTSSIGQEFASIINDAYGVGIAIVSAAGNGGDRIDGIASLPNVITVGASSQEEPGLRMSYSNIGNPLGGIIKPELVAPVDTYANDAVGMITTGNATSMNDMSPTDNGVYSYGTFSGTSFAAPQVSGAMADLMDKYKKMDLVLDPGRIYAMLLSQATGEETGSNGLRMDNHVGAGTLNLRYNTLETLSGENQFNTRTGSGSIRFSIDVPENAEALTVAPWWPNDSDEFHFDLLLLGDGGIVERSTYESGSVQRLILDNPVTGDGAYSINVLYDGPDTGFSSNVVYYSWTFTLPNDFPSIPPQNYEQTVDSQLLKISASDSDLDILSFYVYEAPAKGIITPESGPNNYLPHLTRTSASMVYDSNPNETGIDSFKIAAWDGKNTVVSDPINIVLMNPDPPPPPPAEPPNIIVSDIVIPPNSGRIFLDASQTTGTGDISFLWHQGNSGAPIVHFSNPETAIASFLPPFVSDNQTHEFIFLIEATNDAGKSTKIISFTLDLTTPPPIISPPATTNPGEIRNTIFEDQFENFNFWDEHSEWDLEEPEVTPVGIDTNNQVAHIEQCRSPPCYLFLDDPLVVRTFDRLEMSFWMWFGGDIQNSDQIEVEGAMIQIWDRYREWQDLETIMVGSHDVGRWFKTTIDLSSLISREDIGIRLIPMIEGNNSIIQIDALQIDSITIDNTPPVFDPISDIHSTTDSSGGVIVDYPLPTASDAEIKNVEVFCNPQSGIVFPIGTTMVTCTSNDSAGNTATVTFNVIVTMLEDTIPPTIIVPDDVTAEVTCPGTSVNLGQATAIDNTDSNPTITSNSTTQFPPGTTIILWTATDASGNMANATQTVTIRDRTNPVLVPIDNLVSESITVNDYANMAPSVTDNSCDIITPTHDAPESFPVGTTTVTWTATDSAGNSASTTHTVTIQDVAPPIIMAPLDVISEVTCPGTAVSLGMAAVSDNYDPSPQIRHDAPDSFPLGTTTVIWTATDDSGNMATDEQLVTIRDTTKPVLVPIDNLVSEPITVHDYANMAPSVTDNSCDVIIPTHDAPESFPLGDTIVTWTATDMAGNSASTTHTVTIHTAELMIIAPFDVISEVTCPGTTVSLGMAAVSDNYDPSPEITNDAPDSFPLGTTTVTWTATDSAGTVATDTQQVTVRDTTAPGIRQVNDITQESTATLTQISLTAPGTVDNSCDVPTLTHDAPGSFPVGITVVTWTATDSSGNSAKAIQIITILGDGMPQPLQAYRIISNTLDDSNRSQDHSLVRLGDTFVLAHKNGGQGVIRSFDVSSDGRSITQLDALPHRSGLNEDMIQIGDNTLALVYAGNIDTLRVTDGDITPIKTHGIGSGYGPELVRLGHDTYALAYGYNSKSSDVSILRIPSHGNEVEHLDRVAHASTRTVNHNGVYMDSGIFVMAYSSLGGSNLVTFSVSSSNQISKLADMQYYPKKSFGTSVVAIDEDTVALGYTSLEGAYVKTYNVATNGTLSYVSQAKLIGSLSVDINIVHLSGQTYLAAYSDGGYGGWMRPLLIDNDGSITMGPAVMHDDQALYGSLVRADDDTAVFAYQGANSVSKIAILGVVTPEP